MYTTYFQNKKYSSSKPNTNISNVIEYRANIYVDFKLLGKTDFASHNILFFF